MTLAQQRRDRLVRAMNDEGIEALVVYGTGWQEPYLRYVADFGICEGHGIAIVTADGDCRLYLDSAAEAERAAGEIVGVATSLVRDVGRAVGDQLDRIANHRLAAAPRHLLPSWLVARERSYELEDGTALLDRLMMTKMPDELAAMRRAAVLADEGYAVFRNAARPGRHQYQVIAEVEAFFRTKGSPDNFQIMGSGGPEVKGMAAPSERILKPGDLVTTELTPSVDGYFAQICRTLVLGKATPVQSKAFNVYREAMEAGIAAVRPGVTAADVARAENDVFRKYGLGDYVTSKFTRVRGHGLGLSCDSKPSLLEDVDTVLEAGMTIIVHPNTYNPEAGYVVLGDSVIVTATGAEVLNTTPRELFETQI
jgi:Xaa-Pro dipeptidase